MMWSCSCQILHPLLRRDNDQEFTAGSGHWLLYASILFAEANNIMLSIVLAWLINAVN